MKPLSLLFILSLLVSAFFMVYTFADEAPLKNKSGNSSTAAKTSNIEVGAFVGTNPPTVEGIKKFERFFDGDLYSIMWFQGWDGKDQPAFPKLKLDKILSEKTTEAPFVLHLTWEPAVDLKDISKGVYDSYLKAYADSIKSWGKEVRFRFAHEMIQDNNLDGQEFYRWQDQPKDYVKAFRHVHDIFKAAGANNTKFVWCPNNSPFEVNILKQYYPGKDYVDWLCMDGYNWANSDGKPGWPDWAWFDDIFANIYNTFVDNPEIFGDKPIMIGEFASCEAGPNDLPGQNKAEWIKNAFERMTSTEFNKIKSFHWFHINKECDWRVNSSTSAENAFRTAVE
jgi:beta-mannanase